ncbi:hypothetical protein BP5796_05714 [Coleophoma crateriformis]|uniref:Zn(2)-C6 fungal-type domain-containing protein n=1 Tax=Coleophoma crateriformis TaxID=565419 RepID=A0A3D8RUW5_9HELO|nr:hypothetical protein BP5796_05714 [Coleophoma crateriformis]
MAPSGTKSSMVVSCGRAKTRQWDVSHTRFSSGHSPRKPIRGPREPNQYSIDLFAPSTDVHHELGKADGERRTLFLQHPEIFIVVIIISRRWQLSHAFRLTTHFPASSISSLWTMPGIPKSCAICQARKVKCDRGAAGCSQCLKYEWNCPGYPVSQAKRMTSRQTRRGGKDGETIGYSSELGLESRTENISGRPQRRVSSQSFDHSSTLSSLQDPLHDQSNSPSIPLSNLSLGFLGSPLALELVNCLSSTSPRGLSLDQLGSFIRLVPPRLGTNNALDDAVKCLCAGYTALMCAASPVHYLYYSKALRSLHSSLYNRDTALSAEILCASICLSWYEVLVDTLNPLWLVHTSGSARLIQLRGPEKHTDGFGRALLQAEHGPITAHALMERRPCFLSDFPWAAIVDLSLPESGSHSDPRRLENTFKFLDMLSLIRKDMDDFEAAGGSGYVKAIELIKRLKDLRQSMRKALLSPCPYSARLVEGNGSLLINNSNSVIRCEDALAHITIDVAILSLRQILEAAHDTVTWVADILPHLISMFETQPMSEATVCGFNHLHLLKHVDNILNAEIDALFDLSRVYYREATLTSPLSCRRLASICRAMYLRLETDEKNFHPIWHRIDAMMREES